jgi:Phosphotransferase enzyme family
MGKRSMTFHAQETLIGDDIEAQRIALCRRIEESGLYQNEIEEFDVAVKAYGQIARRLGIVQDIRNITTPESRNLVRHVRMEDGSLAVMKITGNTREPGEGELLAAWYRAGLPTVKPISWGYVRVVVANVGRTATYVLTRFVDARRLPEPRTLAQREELVTQLVSLVRPFHDPKIQVSRARRWSDRIRQHLRWTLPLVRQYGLAEPEQWTDKLDRLSEDGRLVVHGDPASGNVLDTVSGLLLIDPPGALIALPEADIAQICSQVGGVEAAAEMIELASDHDPTLDPSAIAGFAGLNFLVWGGYLLAQHPNPDANHSEPTAEAARQDAQRYLALARQLLHEYRLP